MADTVVYAVWFGGGLRIIDVADPESPREIGHFIPPVTANTTESCITIAGVNDCKKAVQTNNVNLDDRGYIYAVDRASTGLHILELAGEARNIAGF